MRRALSHPLRTAIAAWLVLRAGARVLWHEPHTELPDLAAALKRAPRSRLRVDPPLLDAVVERLLPVLPPFGAGRCVKRSLLQLDLCSRRGLRPRLHLGLSGTGRSRHGHVWVSTESPATREAPTEAWSG